MSRGEQQEVRRQHGIGKCSRRTAHPVPSCGFATPAFHRSRSGRKRGAPRPYIRDGVSPHIPDPLPPRVRTLDNGLADLERDPEASNHFWIQHQGKFVETLFGPTYPVAMIWLPRPPEGQIRQFKRFEPLAAILNG
jgi:hypothetical protein